MIHVGLKEFAPRQWPKIDWASQIVGRKQSKRFIEKGAMQLTYR